MGVSYGAVIAIGKTFDDRHEASSFLIDHVVATEEEIDDAEGISEYLYNSDTIGGGCLNFYSGDHYYIGFDISVRDPESFRKSFEDGMEQWDKLFPNDPPDVIKTVRVS